LIVFVLAGDIGVKNISCRHTGDTNEP
jgi:hypothetical protein